MDSLTQAALGAAIGGAIAPTNARRRAIVAGALLGTLPDLDVFIDFGGAVENFTYHRGFSHSLLVLAPFSVLLWLALRRWWEPVKDAPRRWLALISLVLLTHALLDAHTAYGTQLFWPLDFHPTSWATLFIIDPLYTLPLLFGVIAAAIRPTANWSGALVRSSVLVSTLYIGWSWVAHGMVKDNIQQPLAEMGLEDAPVFLTPTPFNTLLWRIVVMTEDGYLEGLDSLIVDEAPVSFDAHVFDKQLLLDAGDVWAVEQLRWFSNDFLKASIEDDRLVVTDLRMGQHPNYVFSHVVAMRTNPGWAAMPTELLPTNFDRGALSAIWQRIWSDSSD
ncbi:MAG: metal-dependent hydrolase [Xanthomonadales bacterium]|nr:metal-dependent hydrolase [Xanthomonadales bacterium]